MAQLPGTLTSDQLLEIGFALATRELRESFFRSLHPDVADMLLQAVNAGPAPAEPEPAPTPTPPPHVPPAALDRMSAQELRQFIADQDRFVAEQTQARPRQTQIKLEGLSPEQLSRVAACRNPQDYAQVEQAILTGQPLPPVGGASQEQK